MPQRRLSATASSWHSPQLRHTTAPPFPRRASVGPTGASVAGCDDTADVAAPPYTGAALTGHRQSLSISSTPRQMTQEVDYRCDDSRGRRPARRVTPAVGSWVVHRLRCAHRCDVGGRGGVLLSPQEFGVPRGVAAL